MKTIGGVTTGRSRCVRVGYGACARVRARRTLRRARVPVERATGPNERWSMDFVAARLRDGRWFRALTVVDRFTRQFVPLLAVDAKLNCRFFADEDVPRLTNPLFLAPATIAVCAVGATGRRRRMI